MYTIIHVPIHITYYEVMRICGYLLTLVSVYLRYLNVMHIVNIQNYSYFRSHYKEKMVSGSHMMLTQKYHLYFSTSSK